MTINPDGRRQSLGALSGSREPDPCCTGSGPSGFDPERVRELADLIEAASVPHDGGGIFGDGRRSLRYYASVGIDYFNHDHERCRALFEDAARRVLTLLASEGAGA